MVALEIMCIIGGIMGCIYTYIILETSSCDIRKPRARYAPCGMCSRQVCEPRRIRFGLKGNNSSPPTVYIPWDCDCLEKNYSEHIATAVVTAIVKIENSTSRPGVIHSLVVPWDISQFSGHALTVEMVEMLNHHKQYVNENIDMFRESLIPSTFIKICKLLDISHCPSIKGARNLSTKKNILL